MRFLTHNTLSCPVKGITKGYPLGVEVRSHVIREATFNPDFIIHMLPSMDWSGILVAARAVGLEGMPETLDMSLCNDMNFVRALHTLLLEIHVEEGTLICPDTGRQFPIVNGIPDMR